MTKKEFLARIKSDPYYALYCSDNKLTVNSLVWIIREKMPDIGNVCMTIIHRGDIGMIPDVRHTLIPVQDLARLITSIDVDEDEYDGKKWTCLTIKVGRSII